MTDVAPELLDAIEERFQGLYKSDRVLRRVADSVEAGTATYADAAKYAEEVSWDLARACADVLTDEALHDGRMYYNIADRVLRPVIGEQTELIADVCERTQTALNQAAGIGMKAVRVQAEPDRVQGIVDEAARAEKFADVAETVYSHIENLGRHVVDESVRQNADTQWKAGFSPKVHRTASAGACQWCQDAAGTFEYAEVRGKGNGVWRRHANCGCLIEYEPKSGRREAVDNYSWGRSYKTENGRKVWKADLSEEEIAKRIKASHALTRDDAPARIEPRRLAAARAAASFDRQGSREVTYNDDRQGVRDLSVPDQGTELVERIVEHPRMLGAYTPESLKDTLERIGMEVRPLGDGAWKGVPFESGGGFRVNFRDGGLLQYHPEERSHHGGAYYKISTGQGGKRWYDTSGFEKSV